MKRSTLSLFLVALLTTSCVARAGLVGGSEQSVAPSPASPSSAQDAPVRSPSKAFPPGEWSLAESSSWKRIYAQAEQDTNLMNSSCGTRITFSYDHEAFRESLSETDQNINKNWSVSALIAEVRNVCLDGEDQKGAVANSIRSIMFARAPTPNQLASGSLQISLDLEANPRAHVSSFAAWLRSEL